MQNHINDKSAAEILGVAVQTLSNWRFRRKGPRYLKIGSSIKYRVEDLDDYIGENIIDPEGSEINATELQIAIQKVKRTFNRLRVAISELEMALNSGSEEKNNELA